MYVNESFAFREYSFPRNGKITKNLNPVKSAKQPKNEGDVVIMRFLYVLIFSHEIKTKGDDLIGVNV